VTAVTGGHDLPGCRSTRAHFPVRRGLRVARASGPWAAEYLFRHLVIAQSGATRTRRRNIFSARLTGLTRRTCMRVRVRLDRRACMCAARNGPVDRMTRLPLGRGLPTRRGRGDDQNPPSVRAGGGWLVIFASPQLHSLETRHNLFTVDDYNCT